MVEGFRIEYLADYPEHVQACAAWSFGHWWTQREGTSLDGALDRFKKSARKDSVPLTLIAINEETGLPVATATLQEYGSGKWTEVTPWIACVYTHYRYRRQGFAKAMLERLEKEALRLGYKEIYLKSGDAIELYLDLGYQVEETIESKETVTGEQMLFVKTLFESGVSACG